MTGSVSNISPTRRRFCRSRLSSVAAFALAFALIATLPSSNARTTNLVDLVLVLALDVSASVDEQEFDLQRQGLVDAFRNPRLTSAITRGATGRIAVTAIQWAGAGKQTISVPWTIVRGKPTADRFAGALDAMQRRYHNSETDIAGLIEFATYTALTAPVAAGRRVIDISGDGVDNVRYSTYGERNTAVLAGMTINALAILNETPDLDAYYRAHVIGGPAAFVMAADDYQDYLDAILRKLVREIDLRFAS